MHFVSLDRAMVGVDSRKLDILAKIVTSIIAEETVLARNAGLHGHSIAYRIFTY
jgi:hypothetical protein